MIDKRVLDAIHHTARGTGTPKAVVEALVAKALPSIRLVPQPGSAESLPLGRCRIGGAPDLPEGMPWPRRSDAAGESPDEWEADLNSPLQFILQVNLADVAPFDVAGVLPRAGLLSFFFHWDEHTDPGDEVAYIVLSEPTGLRRAEVPEDLPAESRYQALELVPCLEWTLPTLEDAGVSVSVLDAGPADLQLYRFWDDAIERATQAQGFPGPHQGGTVIHRLLGHPNLIQSPGLADGTRLLLQVDSDGGASESPRTGMMWGDGGRLYYLIGEDRLRAHRLADRPWVLVEMC
jgi:hypothetical protein